METLVSELGQETSRGQVLDLFCPNALSVFARIARQGRRRLGQRLQVLGKVPAADSEGVHFIGMECSPLAGRAAGALSKRAHRLLMTIRRCGRRLCVALREARDVADGATADIVFNLLRDMERQIWLVDSKRGRLPTSSGAVVLFQP